MFHPDHWLISRYKSGGRQFPELDCWGLVCDVYRSIGITLPEFVDLSQKTMQDGAETCIAEHLFIPVDNPIDFDIIAFFRSNLLFHVGIWHNSRILHTTQRKNCRYEPLEKFMAYSSSNISVRYFRCILKSTQELI